MIKVETLIQLFYKNNINFFTGVPDSVLKEFSSELEKKKTILLQVMKVLQLVWV